MTTDKAKAKLSYLLLSCPEVFEKFCESTGDDIDSDQLASDLIDWQNIAKPTRSDVNRLLALAKDGRFQSWECPTCGANPERVFVGDPKDWGHFQGANQADYASYPGYGSGSDDRRCDHCRMYMVGGYIPKGMHLEYD
jgi:hypothetical protein